MLESQPNYSNLSSNDVSVWRFNESQHEEILLTTAGRSGSSQNAASDVRLHSMHLLSTSGQANQVIAAHPVKLGGHYFFIYDCKERFSWSGSSKAASGSYTRYVISPEPHTHKLIAYEAVPTAEGQSSLQNLLKSMELRMALPRSKELYDMADSAIQHLSSVDEEDLDTWATNLVEDTTKLND